MGFFTSHINMLLKQGHTVDLACNIGESINLQILEKGCNIYNIEFQRSPLKISNFLAYRKLKKLIAEGNYDLVHTHTPVASVCSRLACKNLENVKVMYTAHGFHFFKGAPLKNWLLYYPIERFMARYTDILITINSEDYARAKRAFRAKRVEFIPGVGIDTKRHGRIIIDKKKKRLELGIPINAGVILSVGELNSNKNHETIIKAMAKLNNPNLHYAICGNGPFEEYLRKLINSLDMKGQVTLLGFRKDVSEIYHVADVFVFPSYREGLSVALMEAMASGLPIICSDIRGNNDLIVNGKGGYLVKPTDINMFAQVIAKIICDIKLCLQMGLYNKEKIEQYDIDIIKNKLAEIYATVWK